MSHFIAKDILALAQLVDTFYSKVMDLSALCNYFTNLIFYCSNDMHSLRKIRKNKVMLCNLIIQRWSLVTLSADFKSACVCWEEILKQYLFPKLLHLQMNIIRYLGANFPFSGKSRLTDPSQLLKSKRSSHLLPWKDRVEPSGN